MTRLIGEHFKRDGRPKHPYSSKAEAKRAALRLRGYEHDVHVYFCQFCQQWHLATTRGHVPTKGGR